MPDTASSEQAAGFSSAFAIFEGGGARGLAHVGALRALEEEGHALVGVAGTSAGAIIAALVAVGYRPDEIFTDGENNILTTLGHASPIAILGHKQWAKFRRLRKRAALTVFPLGCPFLLLAVYSAAWLFYDFWAGLNGQAASFMLVFRILAVCTLAGLVVAIVFGWWFGSVLRSGGLFDSAALRNLINDALRHKLAEHYASIDKPLEELPDVVCFKHIDPAVIRKCVPLKIVVTNVQKGQLELFDNRDHSTPVAGVVAASAALPLAFRPARLTGDARFSETVFTDGGLVSNLPSWAFREEKKAREREETHHGATSRIPIYAFALRSFDEPEDPKTKKADRYTGMRGSLRYALDVLNAGVFGSQSIVADFIPDLRPVELRTRLKTVDFDCSGAAAKEAVEQGYEDARGYLRHERLVHEITKLALEEIQSAMMGAIAPRPEGAAGPRLRVFLIDPIYGRSQDDVRGFRIVAGCNCNTDADDRLELDLYRSIVAEAFHSKKPTFGRIGNRTAAELFMTKYERALLPPDLESVIAIPVFADPEVGGIPQRILAIDSNDDLLQDFDNAQLGAILAERAAAMSRKMIEEIYTAEFGSENEND